MTSAKPQFFAPPPSSTPVVPPPGARLARGPGAGVPDAATTSAGGAAGIAGAPASRSEASTCEDDPGRRATAVPTGSGASSLGPMVPLAGASPTMVRIVRSLPHKRAVSAKCGVRRPEEMAALATRAPRARSVDRYRPARGRSGCAHRRRRQHRPVSPACYAAPSTITDGQIIDLVYAGLADGSLPQPTEDTLYMLYFPASTTITTRTRR